MPIVGSVQKATFGVSVSERKYHNWACCAHPLDFNRPWIPHLTAEAHALSDTCPDIWDLLDLNKLLKLTRKVVRNVE